MRNDFVRRFAGNELLSALALVYPQYHYDHGALRELDKEDFEAKLTVITEHYGVARQLSDGTNVPALLDSEKLHVQHANYLAFAPSNARVAVEDAARLRGSAVGAAKAHVSSRLTLYWRTLSSRANFDALLSE